MGRLTTAQRMRIITLRRHRNPPLGVTEIVQQLASEDVVITKKAVYNLLKKYDKHKSVSDLPPPPRPRKNVTNEVLDFIDEQMEGNDETTSEDLQKNISRRFGVNYSRWKVKDLRRKLGWISDRTRYCQLVREANREKRLNYATECIAKNEQFNDVIWSDECNIQLDWNGNLTFHRWWDPCPQKGKPKHPFKVSVWAAISKRGASPILVFTGIMEKTYYSSSIVKDTLVPFVKSVFPDGHRFMQDNDPKHTSKLGIATMLENGINWWRTPAESPDMNPIENLWHEIKFHLRTRIKPRSKDELTNGIAEFWKTVVTPEKCRKYIGHIQRVLPVVVERNGKASGF